MSDGPMGPDRWAALKDEFVAVADLPPTEQAERLTTLASTDPDLARRLRDLLAADRSTDSLLHAPEATNAGPGGESPPTGADPFGLAGRRVSHFELESVLGCGGMGMVYRAQDLRLGRTVALKFLLPQYTLDPSAKERFLREARAASALDHPNVCTVHEVGESEVGQLFLAMAYYGGETLKDRLARTGPLPLAEAVEIGHQTLLALEAAHAGGIVHRDLKPGNLMLTAGGTLKVLDFGLAKVRDHSMTNPGLQPGTVAYMSPEQLHGDPLDHRTDLWSLGVVLYEMLIGKTPFGRGHDLSTLYSIASQDVSPPSNLRPDVPPTLDAIITRLLRKDAAQRYADAREVLLDLERIGTDTEPSPAAGRRHLESRPKLGGPMSRRVALVVLAAAGLGLAALAIAPGGSGGSETEPAPATLVGSGSPREHPSLVVLPFVDLSPQRDQEYLTDGITEDILNTLARVPGLRVPARTSSFYFKGKNLPVGMIARQLGVETVLEGSVRRVGDRVRVTAQLVDARADRHLWSQTFDRDLEDVFAIQTEIANTVARALQLRLSGGLLAGGRPPAHPAAHEFYLRGLFHWNRRSANDLEHAIRFFREATEVDPNYARPYAGLALAYAVIPISFTASMSAAEAFPRAEAAAARALALDPSLAEAHAARGYAYHWQWRWEDAEQAFQQAIALNAGSATVHQWYGEHLTKMGRGREGEEQMRRAIELDPLSLVAHNDLGIVLIVNRRLPEAIAQLELAHRMDPGFALPLFLLHRAHLMAGNADEAAQTGRRWAEISRMADPEEVMTVARGAQGAEHRPAALAVLSRWEREPNPRWLDLALYYTILNDHDRAITALEQGLQARAPHMAQLKMSPWADPLRDDPRFQRMLDEMGFP